MRNVEELKQCNEKWIMIFTLKLELFDSKSVHLTFIKLVAKQNLPH